MTAPEHTDDTGANMSNEEFRCLLRDLKVFREFISQCSACQVEVPQTWQYCAHCGLRLATECPGCGRPLPPKGGRFCPHCGLEIPASANST